MAVLSAWLCVPFVTTSSTNKLVQVTYILQRFVRKYKIQDYQHLFLNYCLQRKCIGKCFVCPCPTEKLKCRDNRAKSSQVQSFNCLHLMDRILQNVRYHLLTYQIYPQRFQGVANPGLSPGKLCCQKLPSLFPSGAHCITMSLF